MSSEFLRITPGTESEAALFDVMDRTLAALVNIETNLVKAGMSGIHTQLDALTVFSKQADEVRKTMLAQKTRTWRGPDAGGFSPSPSFLLAG